MLCSRAAAFRTVENELLSQLQKFDLHQHIGAPDWITHAYLLPQIQSAMTLRAQAKAELGSAFEIPEFHDRRLENGTIPLTQLRAHLEVWIAEKMRTKPSEKTLNYNSNKARVAISI